MRRLGAVLVAYGLAGLLLLGMFLAAADAAIQRLAVVDPAAGPLADATTALGDAASAFGGFGTSLADAQRAAAESATASRDAAVTADRLADGMSISIFGAQPLLGIAQDFRREAADLDAVARSLDTLAASLRANQDDVALIRADLDALRLRLEAARSGGASVEPLRALVTLLVLWLALPAIASLGAGAWLLRAAERRRG